MTFWRLLARSAIAATYGTVILLVVAAAVLTVLVAVGAVGIKVSLR